MRRVLRMNCTCDHTEDVHESSFYAACTECGCEMFSMEERPWYEDDDGEDVGLYG